MAGNNPFSDPLYGSVPGNAGESNPFDDPEYGKPSGMIRRVLGDSAVTLGKTVIGTGEAAVGIADLVTSPVRAGVNAAGGNMPSFGKALADHTGYDPARVQADLDSLYSPEQQALNEKVAQADGFSAKVSAMVENPSTIAHTIGESAGPMLLGGAFGKAARALPVIGQKIAPWMAGALGEGLVGGGSALEGIRQQMPDGETTGKQALAAAGSGLGTAVIGAGGAKLAQKLGVVDVDTAMVSGSLGDGARGLAARAGQIVKGGLSEGVLQEMPQSAQEQVWQNYALGKPLDEGVGSAAGMGLVTGAAMGAGLNAIRKPAMVQPTPTPENPNPAPVDRPDPNAGPLSRAAFALPAPNIAGLLPSPGSTLYGDTEGNLSPDGQPRNFDRDQFPTGRERGPQNFGPGMDQQTELGAAAGVEGDYIPRSQYAPKNQSLATQNTFDGERPALTDTRPQGTDSFTVDAAGNAVADKVARAPTADYVQGGRGMDQQAPVGKPYSNVMAAKNAISKAAQPKLLEVVKVADKHYEVRPIVNANAKPEIANAKPQAAQSAVEATAIAEDKTAVAKPKGPRVNVNRDSDTLSHAVIRLGGIKTEWRQDTTGDTKGNAQLPGVGALWSDKTGTSIDDMASLLDQHGYVPAGEMESDGGVRWLQAALQDEVSGRKTHLAPGSARQEEESVKAEAQRQADIAAQQEAGGGFDSAQTVESDLLDDTELAEIRAVAAAEFAAKLDAIFGDASDESSPSTPSADSRTQEAPRPETGASGSTGSGQRPPASDNDAGTVAAPQEAPSLELSSQTEAELANAEAANKQRAKDEAAAQAIADEKKRKADERAFVKQQNESANNDFQLGQNADDNVSGQGGMFDAPASQSELDENHEDVSVTVQNGNKEVTITITGRTQWSRDGKERVYFDMTQSNKRVVLSKLYEVISGGTSDRSIDVNGKTYGYEYGIDVNSNTKRESVLSGVKSLLESLSPETITAPAPAESEGGTGSLSHLREIVRQSNVSQKDTVATARAAITNPDTSEAQRQTLLQEVGATGATSQEELTKALNRWWLKHGKERAAHKAKGNALADNFDQQTRNQAVDDTISQALAASAEMDANQAAVKDTAPANTDDQAAQPAPVKWFGSQNKAEAYLKGKKLQATHEIIETDAGRFEVREKAQPVVESVTATEQPDAFVNSPDGSIDFGEITPEMATAAGRQAGKIRLQRGDDSRGLRHIELRHGAQIRKAGYDSVEQFVAAAVKSPDFVWRPESTTQLAVIELIGKGKAVFIQLQPGTDAAGDYYAVNTAFPVSVTYAEKKKGWKLLWSREAVPAVASGELSPFAEADQKAGDQPTMPSGQSSADSVAQPAAAKPTTEPKAKIEDAGDQLKYNKKGMFRSGGLKWSDIKDDNEAMKVKLSAKEKIWARPDWEEIITAQPEGMRDGFALVAHLVKQVYDGIPKQSPGKSDEALQTYIAAVGELRDAAEALLSDNAKVKPLVAALAAKAAGRLGTGGSLSIIDMMKGDADSAQPLFSALFPEQASGTRFARGTPANDKANALDKAVKKMQWGADSAVEAMKAIKKGWPAKQEAWQKQGYAVFDNAENEVKASHYEGSSGVSTTLKLGSSTIEWLDKHAELEAAKQASIARLEQINGKHLVLNKRKNILGAFDTNEEAEDFARKQTARKKAEADSDANEADENWWGRAGDERRPGNNNVTEGEFKEAFGFRGVNFGKWVNQQERQQHLNAAFDAFHDLAAVLDIPPKAISLNGMLGMAFGAQGGGNAAAHFIAGVNEINLTKTAGAGALAHEWAHGLDHYFGVKAGLGRDDAPWASTLGSRRNLPEGVEIRPEVAQAFKSVIAQMRAIEETPEQAAQAARTRLDRAKIDIAMTTQPMREQLAGNAEALAALDKVIAGDIGEYVTLPPAKGKRKPVGAVAANIKIVFDALGYSNEKMAADGSSLMGVYFAKPEVGGVARSRIKHTDFYKKSQARDGKSGNYWATQWEMFARGFESWVMDKLAGQDKHNNYLVRPGKNDRGVTDENFPYPAGEERKAFNQAIDVLTAELKASAPDESGNVALYRLTDTATKGIPLFSAKAIAKKVFDATGLNAKVVANESELPAELQAQIKRDKATGRVAGIYHNGTAYLVASNLRDTQHAISVMLHEAIGHGGVQSVLGDTLGKVMGEIYRDMPAAMRTELERRYAGQIAGLSKAEANTLIAEEYVAHLAETDPQHGVITRLVALLRKFIRDTFGEAAALKWSRNDLVQLLAEARQSVRGNGKGPQGSSRYRETGAAEALAALPEVSEVDESEFVASLKGDAATRSFASAMYQARGTESPFFKGWFGKSRMVDKQGQPIAFVHRSYGERDTFADADLGKNTGTPTATLGHYLARKDVGNVERYGPVVEQFFVRMAKPKVVTQDQFEAMGEWSLTQVQAYKKALMEQGHDGLYIQGLAWPVVFEGKNIKAKRNQGTFDETASTRYSKTKQTATAAFKKWFGDSKAVDANGEPLVAYHVTSKEFSTFNTDKPIFVGFTEGMASVAALSHGRTMALYVRAERPANSKDTPVHFLDVSKSFRDNPDADSVYVQDEGGVSLALRSAEQIKSATGNNGEFDGGNPDIRYSLNAGDTLQAARDLFDRATGPAPLDNNDPFAVENRRLREGEKTLWDKAKKVFARQFSPGGLLPSAVFDAKITRDSEFQAVEFDVRHLSGGLNKAVNADYGVDLDNLTAEQMKPLAEALTGKVDPTIPEGTKAAIVAMRQYIDSLSGEYLQIIQGQIEASQERAATFGPALKAANDARKALNAAIASDSSPAIMQALASKKAALAAQVKAKKAIDGLSGEARAQAKATYEAAVKAHDQAKTELRASLSPELKAQAGAAEALRAEANAARSATADAAAESALYDKITSNLGAYVNRSYQAFDDPNWFKTVPTEVVNAARTYLASGYMEQGETAVEARRLADVTVNEMLKNGTAYDSMGAFIAEGKLGAKDLTVLIKRKEIAPEIRALLGEYMDPRLNFAKSATKMGRLVWNQRFLDRVLDFGMGTLFFEGKNRPADATTQMAGDQSESYAPLNGLWTFPEVAQAFQDALGKEQMSDLYRTVVRLNGMVKYGKTILSPTTAMRNWQSAMFFSLANGHFDLTQMKKSWAAMREQVTQNATGDDLVYLRKLKQLGVVYDTPYAGEMMALLQDARMDELLSSKSGTGLKWLRKVNQFAQGFYSFGDDFWKIIGFENEKASLIDAGFSEADAETMAAKRIRNTYPTYSMIGKAMQWLRRFPLVGTFVSFPSEIIRTTINMMQLVQSDLKSDNPKMRALGRKRALGMALVSGGFYALAAMTAAALGVGDDEEEALRDLAAPWSKNSTFLYTGRDADGKLRYFDMSFLDPYGYWKRPLTAMMRDQPWEKAAASGISDMLMPFFGADITAGAIFEVLANKKPTGGQVFNPNAGSVDQLQDISNHMRKALQPGFVSNGERLWLAGNEARHEGSGQPYDMRDELVSLLGWRASTLDTQTGLYYRSFDFTDGLSNAKKILTRTLRSSNEVTEGDIQESKQAANAQYQKAFTEMGRLVRSAEAAGMSRSEVMQTLKLSGVAQRNIFALVSGRVPPLEIGMQAQARAVRQATVMRDRVHGAEIARRFRLAREQ